ncbi:MAG: hypothetical protein JKX69_15800 [Rhodobacteraceae bacterium]|nr:hypothetical protein [Paracoccaceae bacterium]
MRYFTLPAFALFASPVAADPGHIGALAGHDHWTIGIAVGVAVAAGLYGALKGKDKDAPDLDAEVPA